MLKLNTVINHDERINRMNQSNHEQIESIKSILLSIRLPTNFRILQWTLLRYDFPQAGGQSAKNRRRNFEELFSNHCHMYCTTEASTFVITRYLTVATVCIIKKSSIFHCFI